MRGLNKSDGTKRSYKINPLLHFQVKLFSPKITDNNFNFGLLRQLLWCDHSSKSYWAVLSCGTVYYAVQGGSNIWVRGWNPMVWPFKWNLFGNCSAVLSFFFYLKVWIHGLLYFLHVFDFVNFYLNWLIQGLSWEPAPWWVLPNSGARTGGRRAASAVKT